MAITTSTSTGITQRTNTYAVAKLTAHAKATMVLRKSALTTPIPRNKGDSIKYRRPNPFAAASSPLVEGVTPSGSTFSYETVEAILKQYGDFSKFTDVIEDLHEDSVAQDMLMMHGENSGRTWETLDWATLVGGSNVLYANGSGRNAVASPISYSLVQKASTSLNANKARRFTRIESSSAKYSTFAIESSYIAYAHTDLETDIRAIPGFIPTASYGTASPVCPEEVGSVNNVRFILSPDLSYWADDGAAVGATGMYSTTGTSVDVYPVIILGKEAWGAPRLAGKDAMGVKIKNPGDISDSDPLGQRGICSWKGYHAAVRLNEAWIQRVEVARTAL